MKPKKELRGRIVARYGTLMEFAKTVQMTYRKLNYIVNGRQEATATDIEKMCQALDVEIPEDMQALFFQ